MTTASCGRSCLRNEADNHTTNFTYMNPRVGDFFYPIRVQASQVYVIARMRVREITTVGAFLERHPELTVQVGRFGLTGPLLVGDAGTAIRFNNPVPRPVMDRFSFRPGATERKLTSNNRLQIASRLSLRTAFDLESLVA